MTTSELIESLKKADPSGKLHVRVCDEEGIIVPLFAEKKWGYWDGPYHYIKDGKYYISAEGEKVDIITTNLEGFIYDEDGEVEDKIIFEGKYVSGHKKEEYLKKIKKISQEAKELKRQFIEEDLRKIGEKTKDGWKIIQGEPWYILFFKKGLKKEQLSCGEAETVIKTGLFKLVDNEWVLNE